MFSHGCSLGKSYKAALMGTPIKALAEGEQVALGPESKGNKVNCKVECNEGWTTVGGLRQPNWPRAKG